MGSRPSSLHALFRTLIPLLHTLCPWGIIRIVRSKDGIDEISNVNMSGTSLNEYEARRLENIRRNQALVKDLGIQRISHSTDGPKDRPVKRRKIAIDARPSRNSARIASTASRPSYNEDEVIKAQSIPRQGPMKTSRKLGAGRRRTANGLKQESSEEESDTTSPPADVESLTASWSSWTPVEPAPTRDDSSKTFHFPSHPTFTPNKSPEEMLREGCFGGSYFRPLKSRSLGIVVSDDWKELPPAWTAGLNVERFLTSPEYDADVNKYKVQCGQSIEEWEASGWINHSFDVRGWFQWYCRFFMGRRCSDDDRQIRRWRNCVGETGRWRLALLRKYIKLGVKDVFDDGEDGEDAPEVSPVSSRRRVYVDYFL